MIVTGTAWGFATGRFTAGEQHKVRQLLEKLEAHEKENTRRFEEAGVQSSKAMTYIQGVEERIREEYASKGVMDERCAACRRECDQLRCEMGLVWQRLQGVRS